MPNLNKWIVERLSQQDKKEIENLIDFKKRLAKSSKK